MTGVQQFEELSRRIALALDELHGSEREGGDIRSLQKRSIMILQQFYKLLLTDYSPTEWKESKAYLRAAGFPPLRETLRIKPSKLPERLGKALDRFDGPEERKRQLGVILKRLEDAVDDLDNAIYASARVSKKTERTLERLETLEGSIEAVMSLIKKIEAMKEEAGKAERLLPVPDGVFDIEGEAQSRWKAKIAASAEEIESVTSRLAHDERELDGAMDRFRKFLADSGRHLNHIVTLLPAIREVTAPYVKFDSEEITDWEISIAIRNFGKYRSKLPETHPILKGDEESALEALNHLMNSKEAVTDYNLIRRLQKSIESLRTELEGKTAEKARTESRAELEMIREEMRIKGEERRREYQKLMAQIKDGEEELGEVLGEIGLGTDLAGFEELRSEIEGLVTQVMQ